MLTDTPKLSRYGRLNSWDTMKLLALAFMLADHLGYFILQHNMELRAFGRGAIPIFLFLTGFAPRARFRLDLLVLGIGMWVVNYMEGGGYGPLGILFSILFGRLMCGLIDTGWLKLRRPYEWLAVMAVLFLPSYYIFMDGTLALMFVLCGYMQRHADLYPARGRLTCLIFVFLFETLWDSIAFQFRLVDILIVVAVMADIATLLWHFRVQPVTLPRYLRRAEPGLRLVSRYTLWIYALHFSAGQLITGESY